VFGGTRRTPLGISVQLTAPARVAVTVRRAGKVVKRYRTVQVAAGKVRRFTLRPGGLRRGDHRVTIDVRRGSAHVKRTLTSRRL
jgi:hypothetical protein